MEYLCFVDELGITSEGNYIYRFDFTTDKEVAWGEWWNITPASIVPNIKPDINCISSQIKYEFPYKMETACKNSCFSMQDCIDGIISLCFPDLDYDYLKDNNNKPLYFKFGETINDVKEKIDLNIIKLISVEKITNGDESIIDNLINSDELNNDNDDDLENF